MMKSRARLARVFAYSLVLGTGLPLALADSVQVQLNLCNTSTPGICEITGTTSGSTSYGTVTKTLVDSSGNAISSGTGNVEFQVNLTWPNMFLIMQGFGFNGPAGITSSSIVGSLPSNSLPTGYTFAVGPTSNFDGFGSFDYAITGPSPSDTAHQISSLTFFILGSFSSVASFDVTNGKGSEFAADVNVQGCTSAACTGKIASGAAVPEPTAIALYGSGIFAAGWWIRRRFGKRQLV